MGCAATRKDVAIRRTVETHAYGKLSVCTVRDMPANRTALSSLHEAGFRDS
jgi:hypothetical protein